MDFNHFFLNVPQIKGYYVYNEYYNLPDNDVFLGTTCYKSSLRLYSIIFEDKSHHIIKKYYVHVVYGIISFGVWTQHHEMPKRPYHVDIHPIRVIEQGNYHVIVIIECSGV